MKKILVFAIILCTSVTFSQVGIGTSNPQGALDINSTTQGIVPPRVELTSLTISNPVINPTGQPLVAGTVVYNTATAGTTPNNVKPGMYYWDGTKWVTFAGSAGGLDWSLLGNTGTTAATNFIGTTDNEAVIIKSNNIERVRVNTNETVINENALNYNFRAESVNNPNMFIVNSQLDIVTVGANFTAAQPDTFISVGKNDRFAVSAFAKGQNCAAIFGMHQTKSTSTTEANLGGAFDGSGNGITNIPGKNIGVAGCAFDIGVLGTTITAGALGDNIINRQAGRFMSIANSDITKSTANLAGYDSTNSFYYGGYFDGGADGTGGFIVDPNGDINGDADTTDYAWVGVRHLGTNYKILGGGSVSTIVKDEENKGRILFAPESPEITFTDSGVGRLENGVCKINIDPILAKNIQVDKNHALKVFIQLEGDCNGVYVTEKTANGFLVKELQNGKSNTSFSWQLIANRADTRTKSGQVISKHEGIRFPLAPVKTKNIEQEKAKSIIKAKPLLK